MMMNRIGIRPSTANFKSWALLQIQIEVTSSVWKGKNLFVLFPPPHLMLQLIYACYNRNGSLPKDCEVIKGVKLSI